MHDSKLVKLLKTLSKEEFKQFKKYLESPHLKVNKPIKSLYEYLAKHYPDFKSKKLNKAVVFSFLYPNEAFVDVRIRNVISRLKGLVEAYLVHVHLNENQLQKEAILTQALRERNLYEAFEKRTKSLITKLEDQPHKNVRDYLDVMAQGPKQPLF